MPSLKKFLSPSSSAPSPSASVSEITKTKTTTSPNGTKTITRTTKATTTNTITKKTKPESTESQLTSKEGAEIEITGPGSNPKTNKIWMGDEVPVMGRGMVTAIVGEDQLTTEELAKMGLVPQGRWVKVGTTKTVKKTVTRVERKVVQEEKVEQKEKKIEKKPLTPNKAGQR
ncbi:hypothetical protein DL98DRAFT_318700 [Cadophora sp. DSE1049]|nr:hypothetical protein DL98DRAFT_318700 [Cadophora sp. DSE1049]